MSVLTISDLFERSETPISTGWTALQGAPECDGDELAVTGGAATDSYARSEYTPSIDHSSEALIGNVAAGAGFVGVVVCNKANGSNADGYTYYTDGVNGTTTTRVAKIVNAAEVVAVTREPAAAFAAGDWLKIEALRDTPSAGQVTLRVYKKTGGVFVQVGADIVDNGTTFGGAGGSGATLIGGTFGANVFGSGRIAEWNGVDPYADDGGMSTDIPRKGVPINQRAA